MIVHGFKCLCCLSTVFVEYYTFRNNNGRIPSPDSDVLKRSDMCKCSNIGLILDLDGLVHVYCDDLSTVLLCRLDSNNPSDLEILQSHKNFYYQPYSGISSTPYEFIDNKKTSIKKAKMSKDNYVKRYFKKARDKN